MAIVKQESRFNSNVNVILKGNKMNGGKRYGEKKMLCEKGDRNVGVQVCAKPATRNISYPAGL